MTSGDAPSPHLLSGRILPPFAALRAFEAVGRTGGIRKAALALGIDHAVVSRHLRQLEASLEIPLFARSQGKLTLTREGLEYHRRVSAAFVELAAATINVRRRECDNGPLRVWCVPGFANQWLADRLAEFERIHPDTPVELRPTDSPADLRLLEADVDIRYYGDDWPPRPQGEGLRHVELVRPEIIAVASPELAAKLADLTDASQLLDAPLLHEEHFEQWRAWLAVNGVRDQGRLRGSLLWHAHLAIAAARQGRGIALANTYLVANDLENGSLREVAPPGSRRAVIGGYCFVARRDRWTAPRISRLRRFVQVKVAAQGAGAAR